MRRAFSSLLLHVNHYKSTYTFFSYRAFISDVNLPTPFKENPSFPHLKLCKKTLGLLFQFQKNPSRNQNTLVENTPQLPSRQGKFKQKDELEEALESSTTTEEILSSFEEMEYHFDANDEKFGLACLKVGQRLDSQGMDPEKTLAFANKALKILDGDDKVSLALAMALHLLGSVNYRLKRFDESSGFLNRANRILSKLEEEGFRDFDVTPIIHDIQLQLANTKKATGHIEEALVNLRKCLELKETILEPNNRELGLANRELAEAYATVVNFNEALPYCLKALEIHKSQLGQNSVEVVHDRRLLVVIYSGLEEHDNALDQNELSKQVLKNLGLGSDLLHAEIETANIQIALGRYDEANNTLKGVIQQTDKESETRALVFISMAKALCNQEKFADSKRCLEICCGILDKIESIAPKKIADAYMEMAILYEMLNEFETEISLLKKSISLVEKLPQEKYAEGSASARIGWLLLLMGKAPQAIPYLERAAERIKESFGPKHFGMGYIYNNLGLAYMALERSQSAAQTFAFSKEIMDVSLGPHHADSIEACQNLANAYGAMGSYDHAMELQQQVIDAWESHGPSARDEFREAHRLLEQLKKKAGRSSREVPKKALPLPHDIDFVLTKNMQRPDGELG